MIFAKCFDQYGYQTIGLSRIHWLWSSSMVTWIGLFPIILRLSLVLLRKKQSRNASPSDEERWIVFAARSSASSCTDVCSPSAISTRNALIQTRERRCFLRYSRPGRMSNWPTAYEYLLHRLSIGMSQFFLNTTNLLMFQPSMMLRNMTYYGASMRSGTTKTRSHHSRIPLRNIACLLVLHGCVNS